ncbi:MAG: DEAD/DEAH box helicase, partial [Coriobacteriales bacterium]|nr:DEAD/DEAH box helicase [Coriobacteriales bacterium]
MPVALAPGAAADDAPSYLSQAQAQALLNLDRSVECLRYAAGKRLQALQALQIHKLRDLLEHYPFRYNNFTNIKPIASLRIGEKAAVVGRIDELRTRKVYSRRRGRELPVVEASLVDDSGVLLASWFNQPWMARTLVVGMPVSFLGTVEHFDGFLRLSSPLHRQLDEQGFLKFVEEGATPEGLAAIDARIEPVYRARAGITSSLIGKLVDAALELTAEAPELLPASLCERHGLISHEQALQAIHHPPGREEYRTARRRLAYEEVLYAQIALIRERRVEEDGAKPTEHRLDGPRLGALADMLPFALTDDQRTATEEILAEMHAPRLMNRLLLGDVGSGKTVVALHALVAAADTGTQAAMIAPTVVLAGQYALKLGPLLDDLGINWALLSGASSRRERELILEGLEEGSLQVVFGTHALLQDDVRFARLTLAVIDEQHRFGVEQRQQMRRKGGGADILMLSATPIPRSLALVIYGDMTTTWLRSRPVPARTQTRLIGRALLFEAYDAIRQALARGQQAYFICPLIGEAKGGRAAGTDAGGADADAGGAGTVARASGADAGGAGTGAATDNAGGAGSAVGTATEATGSGNAAARSGRTGSRAGDEPEEFVSLYSEYDDA